MSSPTADQAFGSQALAGADLQRRLRNLKRWRRHSALIHVLRRALPTMIVLFLLILLGWAGFNTLALRLNGAGQTSGMSIRMVNPKFFGRDNAGKPFTLSAAAAVRDDNQFQRIYLDAPGVILGDGPADQTRLTAKKGVYREDTRILVLDGDVHVLDANRNEFVSQHALVDTLTKDVDGDSHIDGHGPLGRIASSSYAVRDGGAHVYFRGQVKAHLEQHAAGQQAASAAGASAVPLKGSR
jgi:lipopolysaccharide export system protein LptC